MEITFLNYLLSFLGLTLYVLLALLKAKKTHKSDFNAFIWIQDNLISIASSLVVVVILMLSINDIMDLGIVPEKFQSLINIVSVMFGYFNLSLFKKIADIFNPKKLRK